MTATYKDNGGAVNGSNKVFTYDFPVLQIEDVQVALNGVTISQAKYTASLTPAEIEFVATTESDVQEASGAPKTGVTVRVYRKTIVGKADGNEDPKAVFAAGSSIRAGDLNLDVTQSLFGIHELQDRSILREDLIDDIIDGTKIADGAIADEHIQATAEIQVSKLKDGDARQVLQTAANGTDVEWTDNVDLPGTLDVTGVVDFDQTLNVDGATTIGGTLGVTGESTLASATVSDLTSGRIVFTSTGGALVDSADLTFDTTGDGHLKVGVEGGYGTITCATINATYWNGREEDEFWRVNKNHIDHYGKDTTYTFNYQPAIRLRKHDDNLSSTHTFSIAKDYNVEIGKYYNEGLGFGNYNDNRKEPFLKIIHEIDQQTVTKMNNTYSYDDDGSEHGQIDIGDGTISYAGSGDTALAGTTIDLGGFTYFNARRGRPLSGGENTTDPEDANSYQPVLMLSGQRGAMFVHPENASHLSDSTSTTSGLSNLAYGVGGHGTRHVGNNQPFGYGTLYNGFWWNDPNECLELLEAACDVQIIVGGVRAKNRLEIGSSSVAGKLVLSGTEVDATADELNVLDGIPATLTSTELGYVDGVTSNIQTQLDGKQPLDAELTELATMGANTASALADLTQAEVQIVDGKTFRASGDGTLSTTSDTEIPSSKVVADHVTAVIAPLGGLEVVATDAAFPFTQPDSGVVISISDAGGVAFNGSGTSTTGRTVAGPNGEAVQTVTINNAPSSLYNETLVAGVGLMVSSTGSSQTYDYHKILGKEDDIKQLSDDINDFNARYRIASSAPGSNNDAGDLYYDTTVKKMKVYNAVDNQWDDVAQSSSSYIVTLSEAFDNSRTDFTMSTAATDAQSTLVSINGVLQKPNAGTSTPSEGFAIDGTTLKLAAAPPTGSDYFVVVLGDTVSIGTPSDGTVTNAKVNNNADIEASKLDNPLHFPDNHKISFGTDSTGDFEIYSDGTDSYISHTTGDLYLYGVGTSDDIYIWSKDDIYLSPQDGENGIKVVGNDSVKLYYDGSTDPKFETKSAGVQVYGQLMNFTTGTAVLLGDNAQLELGSSNDLKIWHNADNDSHIRNESGNLLIESNGAGADAIKIVPGAQVELYHNGTKRFETLSTGAKVHGNLSFADGNGVVFGAGADMQLYHDSGTTNRWNFAADNTLVIKEDNSSYFQFDGDNNYIWSKTIVPWADDSFDIGSSSYKWDDIYATNSSIQTSDRNEKNTIVDSDLGLDFVNKLKPVSYKFNGKTRTHYGLIAQDVETVLSDISKSTTDFAGFIKTDLPDQLYDEIRDENNIPEGKKVGDVKIPAHASYGLRYNEFISPLIKAVQELSAEVETLKTKVAALEAK